MSTDAIRIPKEPERTHDLARRQGDGNSAVQGLPDSSPRVSQLRALQGAVTQSPRVQGMLQLKDRLNHDRPQQQLHETPAQANRTGLPDGLKVGIEQASGLSMDDVEVHYNSSKPAQFQALAYTQGTEIHVSPGQERHLPHEAWHVVQQKQGRVKPTLQMAGTAINDDDHLEREAEVMGMRATAHSSLPHEGPTAQRASVSQAGNTGRVHQRMAVSGQRRFLPEFQNALPRASSSPDGAAQPVQMVRRNVGPIAPDADDITPRAMLDYLALIDEQVNELDDFETADRLKLENWRAQFEERYNTLLTEVPNDDHALSKVEIQSRQTALQKRFFHAWVSLQNMRIELNNSLQRAAQDREAMAQAEQAMNAIRGYNQRALEATYEGPKRADPITEWDDRFAYLYRKMSVSEYAAIGKDAKKFQRVTPDNKSRKWFSTTNAHSFEFKNEDVELGGADVSQVIVRVKLDRAKLEKILARRFPAYKTGSYKSKNKDKVLIHQELLAQGNIANTGTDDQLEQVVANREHFNVGFSFDLIKNLDEAIVQIDATPLS